MTKETERLPVTAADVQRDTRHNVVPLRPRVRGWRTVIKSGGYVTVEVSMPMRGIFDADDR